MALTKVTHDLLAAGGSLTLATVQTPSGVALAEFLNIPAGTKQVIVMLHRISFATGNDNPAIQLGHSGGYTTSGYGGGFVYTTGVSAVQSEIDTAIIVGGQAGAGATYSGQVIFTLLDPTNHIWAWQFAVYTNEGTADYMFIGGGSVDMAGELTKLKVYGGTNGYNLDSGSINIAYK